MPSSQGQAGGRIENISIERHRDMRIRVFSEGMIQTYLAALVMLSFIYSCGGTVVKNPASLRQVRAAERPYAEQEYRIQPGDLLDIKFFYNSKLNEQVTVRPDGRISLLLAREVIAAGKTPAELTDILTERYSKELKNPEIIVIVRSFSTEKVFVGGEVAKPGMIDLIRPMTVLQSLFLAGGIKDSASKDEIILIRRKPNRVSMVIPLDIGKAIDGTDTSQDLRLMPYDVVFVPRTAIANLNLWVDQYINGIIPESFHWGINYEVNRQGTR